MKLIILYGLPGVGKKTVGTELAKRSGLVLFDNHKILDIVRSVIPRTSVHAVELAREFRLELLRRATLADVKGLILTFAGGSPGATTYAKQCVEMVEQNGGIVNLVKLVCDKEVLLSRIEDPSRQGTTKLTTPEELEEFLQKNYFNGLPSHNAIEIDNTKLTPAETASIIIEKLNL